MRNLANKSVLCFAVFLVWACSFHGALGEKSYYEVLGVPKQASKSQIKSAYRRLSKQYHPDVSAEPNAKQIFQEIAEAYSVLNDDEQRKVYDQYGKEGLKQRQQGGGGHPFQDIQDIFGQFFGGGGGEMFRRKGQPLVLRLVVTAKELYTGTKITVIVNKRVDCPNCQSGYETHILDILSGMRNGEEITVSEGFNEYQNAEASDLVFRIVEIPTPGFERNGLNLIYRLRISLKEALLGFSREFTNLDEQVVRVTNNTEVTQHEQQIRVPHKGFKERNRNTRGDLVVICHIEMPPSLDPDFVKELSEHF